jgi:hypothetical protein
MKSKSGSIAIITAVALGAAALWADDTHKPAPDPAPRPAVIPHARPAATPPAAQQPAAAPAQRPSRIPERPAVPPSRPVPTVVPPPVTSPRPPSPIDRRPPVSRPSPPIVTRPAPAPTPLRGESFVRTPSGHDVILRGDGTIRSLRAGGMVVNRAPSGVRSIVVERADRSSVVAYRNGYGYVQRPFTVGSREFSQRSYFVNGAVYSRYYRSYSYNNNVVLQVYASPRYYSPAFYGWANNPWGRPIEYDWGWSAAPWYGSYGPYFAPYNTYPSASMWLTDYLISDSLAAAYRQQQYQRPDPGPSGQTEPMPSEVKAYINNEVQRQIELAKFEAQLQARHIDPDPGAGGLARILADGSPHVFVAAGSLSVVDATGLECALTEGDTIQFNPPPPSTDAAAADVLVVWSKGQDCGRASTVTVALADLQEMNNHMRETVDQGLADLRAKQGQGGLPALPPTALGPPIQAQFTANAPPPDPNVGPTISQQVQAADQAEREAARGSSN